MLVIINSHFDNFLACAKTGKRDLYVAQFECFIKIVDSVGIFFKIQEYVNEGKNFQSKMEEIKCVVRDIFVFQ